MTGLKSILLQKLYPNGDKKIPELRFKGYNKEWEEKLLIDVLNINNGKDYKNLNKGNIPVYGSGGYMCSVNKALSYNEDALGIGRKGNIDKPFILKAPFWTVDTLFYCIPKYGYNLYFLYGIFQNINWKEISEFTGVPSLSKKNVYDIKILVPELEEQEKIGKCLLTLDEIMMLNKEKCEKLGMDIKKFEI